MSNIPLGLANVEVDQWPYPSNEFDFVFSKSLVEHLNNPLPYFEEAYRILKPGGILITMVPDWEANYKTYFDDFTHRTPFTRISLNDAYLMANFEGVTVERFRQLPIVWRFPILNIFCALITPFIPVRTKIKFFRWSRELMLVGSGRKPYGS
jgi:SAM-dependent methyltransferase